MVTGAPPGMWKLMWDEKEDWGGVGDAGEGGGLSWNPAGEEGRGWQWSRGEEWGRHKQVAWGG